ncbi:MAG: shikimate kinase [Bacteroidales bacterium]
MHRIFLIGYMGAGKTTIGKVLARRLNLSFIDLDLFIEQRYHKSVSVLFNEKGENKFREIERLMLHEVAEFENVIISTGGGTPVFFDNMEFMNSAGCTIYLEVACDLLTDRLRKNSDKRPLIAGKSADELRGFIAKNLEHRSPYYENAKIKVFIDDEKESIEEIVSRVILEAGC